VVGEKGGGRGRGGGGKEVIVLVLRREVEVEGKEMEGEKESFVVFEEKRNLLRGIWEKKNFRVVEMEAMGGGVK